MQYTLPFKMRAIEQYGPMAIVYDIEPESLSGYDAVMPVIRTSLSGNILGKIWVGDERFEAMYLPEQNEIYTKRNIDKIKQSAVQLFSDMGIEVIDMSLTNYFEDPLWLPDDVVDFKRLLDNNDGISSNVFVKDGLEDITLDDFMWLFAYDRCCITFLQLNDLAEIEAIREMWDLREIVFIPHNPIVYDTKSEEYINLFKYYDVDSYLYLEKHSEDDWEYCFENKDGIVVEKIIE